MRLSNVGLGFHLDDYPENTDAQIQHYREKFLINVRIHEKNRYYMLCFYFLDIDVFVAWAKVQTGANFETGTDRFHVSSVRQSVHCMPLRKNY